MQIKNKWKNLPSNEDFFTKEFEQDDYDEWYRKKITSQLRNALGVGHFYPKREED